MASITDKPNLFFVTSPRSPHKMKEEINLLVKKYSGEKWWGSRENQARFFRALVRSDSYEGTLTEGDASSASDEDLSFNARDRINRAPKALGLVDIRPTVKLTKAGAAYVHGSRPAEAFTRQLLKFQFPSPYHVDKNQAFGVRPYLELLRLVHETGSLSKDEIAAFCIHLINVDRYEMVKDKILQFRTQKDQIDHSKTNYTRFFNEVFDHEVSEMYNAQIDEGNVGTRESAPDSLKNFLRTKKSNHRDYADAAIRYLRETKLVTLRSSRSNRIRVPEEKQEDVEFILENTSREPVFVTDRDKYKAHLFDASTPALLSDDKKALLESILSLSQEVDRAALQVQNIEALKDRKDQIIAERIQKKLSDQTASLEAYEEYEDIMQMYSDITSRDVMEGPLMMEWNTWRAFTMLDDGNVKSNFRFDDTGLPLSTAPGNKADIICSYDKFDLTIEVTLSSGETQFKMEADSVPKHLGKHKKQSSNDAYCLFVARSLSDNTVAHFYTLHHTNVSYYGGKAKIIPLSLSDLEAMLEDAHQDKEKPNARTIERFVRRASQMALQAENEQAWRSGVEELARAWTNPETA